MGCAHGIAVCNGSAAIDVALAALRIGPGDEVILPSLTIISCAAAIVRAGAVPVVVDCQSDTWNIDPMLIAAKITSHTKAIMVVHIYGLPVDMDPVTALARKHGLFIIEDAAEQHGQTYKGKPVGSFGDIATVSFYPKQADHDRRRRYGADNRPGAGRSLPRPATCASTRSGATFIKSSVGTSA